MHNTLERWLINNYQNLYNKLNRNDTREELHEHRTKNMAERMRPTNSTSRLLNVVALDCWLLLILHFPPLMRTFPLFSLFFVIMCHFFLISLTIVIISSLNHRTPHQMPLHSSKYNHNRKEHNKRKRRATMRMGE